MPVRPASARSRSDTTTCSAISSKSAQRRRPRSARTAAPNRNSFIGRRWRAPCASLARSLPSSSSRSRAPRNGRLRSKFPSSMISAMPLRATRQRYGRAARTLAEIDVASGLAELAASDGYVRPKVDSSLRFPDPRRTASGRRTGAARPVRASLRTTAISALARLAVARSSG